MDDEIYKNDEELSENHKKVANSSTDDIFNEEEKEYLGSFISEFQQIISSFLEISPDQYESSDSIALCQQIIHMIQRIDENEKESNYERCIPFFSPFSLSELIHCIFNCSNSFSIQIICDLCHSLSRLVAHLTQNTSSNYSEILEFPVLEGLSTIFQNQLPENCFMHLIIFVRNMLDTETAFDKFSELCNFDFFEQILSFLPSFSEPNRSKTAEYVIMCLYTFTKYSFNEENTENLTKSRNIFSLQMKLINFIKSRPIAIGFLAYSWVNMINYNVFDYDLAKQNKFLDIIENLLQYFIKPYSTYTNEEQESLGHVLFLFTNLFDSGADIELPEIDFSFLCDIMRNGNDVLFHYASLILSQQVFQSTDIDYLKQIIEFLINLFDSSTQKKLAISLFLCDVIVSSEPVFYQQLFDQRILKIIFDTLLLDHSEISRTILIAEALLKMCEIADIIGETDNLMEFLTDFDNHSKLDEFYATYEEEKPGEIINQVFDYINENTLNE